MIETFARYWENRDRHIRRSMHADRQTKTDRQILVILRSHQTPMKPNMRIKKVVHGYVNTHSGSANFDLFSELVNKLTVRPTDATMLLASIILPSKTKAVPLMPLKHNPWTASKRRC